MRTLSARILLGFVLLTITFGVFVATIVVNLREVEDQASLVLRGYVPLAMTSSDLAQRQDDLKSYLEQGIQDAQRGGEIRATLTSLLAKRARALGEIVKGVENLGALVTSDGQAATEVYKQFSVTAPAVDKLNLSVQELAPRYATILAAPPVR